MRTFGERVKYARGLGKISARRLDLLADLTPGHVSAIEAGQRERIEARTASMLAAVLGCSLDWLIDGDGPAPSERAIRAAVAAAVARRAA